MSFFQPKDNSAGLNYADLVFEDNAENSKEPEPRGAEDKVDYVWVQQGADKGL